MSGLWSRWQRQRLAMPMVQAWLTFAGLTVAAVMLAAALLHISQPRTINLSNAGTRIDSRSTVTTQDTAAGAAANQTATSGCRSDAGLLQPDRISLAGGDGGLRLQSDTKTYALTANTPAALRQEIAACAPSASQAGSEYTAYTAYAANWQYDLAQTGAVCRVQSLKLGMHIRQVMPDWQPAARADSGLQTDWQRFMVALKTHEDGHAQLDRYYAGQATNLARSQTAVSCAALATKINTVINSQLAALNQANETYDADTGHGAAQGAILP